MNSPSATPPPGARPRCSQSSGGDAGQPGDVLIIGGGAAGLTAALYLARFRRGVMLIDAGNSRLLQIPRSHNYPGFPDGIPGADLLARLREQVAGYGVQPAEGVVERLEKSGAGFRAYWRATNAEQAGELRVAHARQVVLATGVEDVKPALPHVEEGVRKGHVRYCPICDAYEATGKNLLVMANGSSGVGESIYLRHFTDRLTLLNLDGEAQLSESDQARLSAAGVRVESRASHEIALDERVAADSAEAGLIKGGALRIRHDVDEMRYDAAYCALGTRVHNELACMLGAECEEDGSVLTDRHQRTSVEGVYAVGDVAPGINQIAVATGQAAIAASAIHLALGRHLAATRPG